MTDFQAEFLLFLVDEAEANGGELPPARVLREHLPANHKISEKRIRDLITLLDKAHGCFTREGNIRFLNSDRIVTEPETAFYLLELVKQCKANKPAYRTSKHDLHNAIRHRPELAEHNLDEKYKLAMNQGYLTEAGPIVRVGRTTTKLLKYLELLAGRLTTPVPPQEKTDSKDVTEATVVTRPSEPKSSPEHSEPGRGRGKAKTRSA